MSPANRKAESPEAAAEAPRGARVGAIDVFRGLVLALMIGEVLHFCRVAEKLPGNVFWEFLCYHQSHVEWTGCSLHDLIQPGFTFLVGVSLPFSLARRQGEGQSALRLVLHALARALILIYLGIFLRSIGRPQTNYTFEDTLTQIGLGYVFLFLAAQQSYKVQWGFLGLLLGGYWLAFVLYPLPGPAFDWARAGVDADWPYHLQGFAAHWNKNTNFAWAFDTWFLNLFPREEPFQFNRGGYATLSFIPTLGTMILGLRAGELLRCKRTETQRVTRLVVTGAICLSAGWLLGAVGICPIVKRIWTPSWTLFSAGWCFLLLAALYAVIDLRGLRGWFFPLAVLGMNSIAAYLMNWLFVGFIRDALERHLGLGVLGVFGAQFVPLVQGTLTFLILWGILYWMHCRRLYLRL